MMGIEFREGEKSYIVYVSFVWGEGAGNKDPGERDEYPETGTDSQSRRGAKMA
jgi:hypothetical protein